MEDTIGERLDRMEELICSIAERLTEVARPLPTILKRADAARELGVSLSVLKGMLRRGEILESQKRGETRGIPRSEILRLATPTQPKNRPKGGGPRGGRPRASGGPEAEKIRALTRR